MPQLKKILGQIHLWVGLITGLLIFLISFSGALYAFRDEIYGIIYSAYLDVEPQQKAFLPPSEIWAKAQTYVPPGVTLNHLEAYNSGAESWVFRAYKSAEADGWNYFQNVEYDLFIYVNPYDGSHLGTVDLEHEFFQVVKMFHWSFLLSTEIGQPIIGYSILFFLLSMFTGFYLWWKRKMKWSKKLAINWKAKWRRVNYDLHSVLGMYSLIFGVLFALTGLVWSFTWFSDAVYTVANLDSTRPEFTETTSDEPNRVTGLQYIDRTYQEVSNTNPNASSVFYSLPHHEEDSAEAMEVYIKHDAGVWYSATSEQYDWKSGKLLHRQTFSDRNTGEKVLYMNYDIHVGAILGLSGKIIAFIASLCIAAMPITGFYIWYGRKFKKPSKKAGSNN